MVAVPGGIRERSITLYTGVTTAQVDPQSVKRWRELLSSERDAAALYARLAEEETGERHGDLPRPRGHRAQARRPLRSRLRDAGAEVLAPGRPSLRTRLFGAAAGTLSVDTVLPLIERAERSDAGLYDAEPDAAPDMAADQRSHARTLAHLMDGGKPDRPPQSGGRERWHRGDRSGALRAAGSGSATAWCRTPRWSWASLAGRARTVTLLAGIAGLLGRSFSMAAGDTSRCRASARCTSASSPWSRPNSRRSRTRTRRAGADLRAKGLSRPEAERLADEIMSDRSITLATLAREGLGLDPGALGSPGSRRSAACCRRGRRSRR